jgi:UDP-2,3-diacylglucosamine pyrophosphatase LpxH
VEARQRGSVPLNGSHRYVIFSDHHKGGGVAADDFGPCKSTYLAALDHYFNEGFHLIVLGDAEELWEESIERVLEKHQDVFDRERRFHEVGRYQRLFGNHDNNWASKGQVAKHLHPIFPGLQVHEGLVFTYTGPDPESSGEVFLAHGHQGTLDSEVFAPVSRVFVRGFWRTFQILFKYSGTQPSKSECLRGEHDTLMYRWAAEQGKLMLIAGHTHRAIWSSQTLLEKKRIELRALQLANELVPIPDYEGRVAALTAEFGALKAREQLCRDTLKTSWCYFNDGCCCFSDGSVTGYELQDGVFRLVRWDAVGHNRTVLDEERLAHIFYAL